MPIPSDRLRLSAQRALLGNVLPGLRAVCIESENNKIYINFYYDGLVTEESTEAAESTVDDIISDFHIDDSGHDVEFFPKILQVDYPQKMPLKGNWVYYRKEE